MRSHPVRHLAVVAALLVAGVDRAPAAASGAPRQPFPGSIRAVPPASATAHRFGLLRRTLTAGEEAEALDIELALPMRSLPELLERIGRGETIARAEMEEQYYPLQADYDRVAQWVASQGLTVMPPDSARLAVFARGSIADLARAFQVKFGRVRADDGDYTSAISVPTLPGELAPVLLGVNGLQPHLHPRRHTRLQPASLSGNGPPFLPWQIAHAYGGGGLTVTGAGQMIAIVIDTFPKTSDLTSYWSACGVSQSLANIQLVQVISGTLPATSGEETLDVEWSSSIAPGAKVRVYATKSLSFTRIDAAYSRILSDLTANPDLHVMSLSFGLGETYTTTTQMQTDDNYFAALAGAGVTICVSSGDGGSSPGTSGHDHTGPVQAETPASDPNVTAVGGTSITVDATSGDLTGETAWSDSGGGVSSCFSRPAWQTGAGVPAGSWRCVPDVAAAADINTGGFMNWNGSQYIVGGTSWSAPMWAGFCALINQARAANGLSALGQLGPRIYPIAAGGGFHDIVTGSNGSNGIYDAGPGYDLCSGVGTPNLAALLPALAAVAPGITMQPAAQNIAAGGSATFTVTASGTPPFAYQWQSSADGGTTWSSLADGTTYSGATTPSLMIAAADAGLNGIEFRCVVSNAAGSLASSAATLTVATISDSPALPAWAVGALGCLLFAVAVPWLARGKSIARS